MTQKIPSGQPSETSCSFGSDKTTSWEAAGVLVTDSLQVRAAASPMWGGCRAAGRA